MTVPVPIPDDLPQRLLAAERVLISSHRHPDGDAVGSSLAAQRLLAAHGIESTVWLYDPVPANLARLPGSASVHNGTNAPDGHFDLALVVECPAPDRTGLEEALSHYPIVNIDHHLGNAHYGVENWVDPDAPSVGCLFYRLSVELPEQPDSDFYNLLLATLYTDTGGFRYANATERAFSVASELVRHGAHPETVAGWVYENRTESSVRLMAEAMRTLRLDGNGRIATLMVTRSMLASARPGDTEGLVDIARSIAGVTAAALLRETDGGEIKVSLRSRGDVNVEPIARKHGGGGHDKAAGFQLQAQELDKARNSVVALLLDATGTDR